MQATRHSDSAGTEQTDASKALGVSVVIPCFNCVETIDHALNSVLNQTKQPAEIILIDDQSADGTLDRLHDLQTQHPQLIKVIQTPKNAGPGPARNAGWDESSQPWIAFLDADDFWHPRKLELQTNWIKSKTDVMLCGHRSRQSGQPIETFPAARITAQRITLSEMLVSNRLPTRSVMVRRDVNLRFRGKEFSEDYLLWLQIIAAGMPTYALDACLAYSIRPDFSASGFSGQLWRQERRELASLKALHHDGAISTSQFLLASAWSLLKYPRRVLVQH